MRIFSIALLILLAQLCPAKNADAIVVIYKTDTKEVLSVQDDDSAVLENGCTKEVLSGTVADYPLEYNPLFYKFVNKKFVADTKKISDLENAKLQAQEMAKEKKLIESKLQDVAIDSLRAEGKTLKYFKKTGE